MRSTLLLIFFLFSNILSAQTSKTDSLINKLESSTGQEKVNVYIEISKQYRPTSLDTAKLFLEQALQLANQLNDQIALARSYLELGSISYLEGNSKEAISYCDKGIAILGDKDAVLLHSLINNKGNSLIMSGQLDKGLQCYTKVLKYRRSI